MMRRAVPYAVSVVGMLVLFSVFLVFQMPSIPSWGTLKLTDILIIVGGLMFILPIYFDSVRRKGAHNAPNRWVWAVLPPVGIVAVVIGVLVPNSAVTFGMVSLPDLLYLLGCLAILPVFVYPLYEVERDWAEREAGIDGEPKTDVR